MKSTLPALLLLVALPVAVGPAEEPTPREILDRFDDLYRGDSSRAVTTSTAATPRARSWR